MTLRAEELDVVLARWRRGALVAGVLCLGACLIGACFDLQQFFRAYAFTYFYLVGFSIGSLGLVMIHHLTGGAWGLLIRRIMEAQMRMMPIALLLFVPICFGLSDIYLWANSAVRTAGAHQTLQQRYLNSEWFIWRSAGYFAVWLVLAGILSRWSRKQDEAADVQTPWNCAALSGPGLVLLGITLHFAATDWIQSLQSEVTSTIFGPLVFAGQVISALALSIVVFCGLSTRPEFEKVASKDARNDLGSLLLTILILLTYLEWFQFMLIWMADLPRGDAWYLARSRHGWNVLIVIVVVLHFALPFFLLLMQAVKQSRLGLGLTAGWILFMHLFYMFLQVVPVFGALSWTRNWMDLLMPLGLGGIWTFCFLWLLPRRPLLPVYDLNYRIAFELHQGESAEQQREEALSHG